MPLQINPVLTETESPKAQDTSEESLPLNQLLGKIVAQYGPFAGITEDSITANEADEDVSMVDAGEVVEEESEEDSTTPKGPKSMEEFMKEKEKALSDIGQALNESSLSLDFVSLLISCVRPAAGSSSMSPHLKQHVKIGALSSDRVQVPEQPENAKEKSAGRGWKLQSLSRASSNLAAASKRLGAEIEKEKRYWDGLMQVVESDEVMIPVKTRNKGKEIGVKYGFGDAGSDYYNKGVGLLKKRESGEVCFEHKSSISQEEASADKLVRVRIYQKNDSDEPTLVGESHTQIPSGPSVLDDIRRARFLIFEEELFYQMTKEAATIIALQVRVETHKITLEVHNKVIEVSYVGESDNEQRPSDAEANEIVCFLRLMLCAQHRRNLETRRVPPMSLTKQSRKPTPKPMLLRPLMTYKRHNRTIRKLEQAFRSILTGLSTDADQVMAQGYKLHKFTNDPNNDKFVRLDPFVRPFLSPVSTIDLNYNDLHAHLILTSNCHDLNTSIVTQVDNKKGRILDVTFNGVREVEGCLSWVMRGGDA